MTAVDKYDGMLAVAREKCDADFRRTALPDLALNGEYDGIVAVRGVVNHLLRDELLPALETVWRRLADGGIVVFDNSALPPGGNEPGLAVGSTERGDYARVAQYAPTGDGHLDRREVVFTPDGEIVANSRIMTPFSDETVVTELNKLGFDVSTDDGYGPDDHRTVFVVTRPRNQEPPENLGPRR